MILYNTALSYCNSAINENGWIAGSYTPDGSGATELPMLYIPNDVDNDGVPDIREIMVARINGTGELDVNGNWLLDSAEQMRVGLFGPNGNGIQSKADQIGDVQVVRLMGFNQGILYNVVNNIGCDSKADTFNHWGYEKNVEVIINSRTIDPSSGPAFNFDFLLSSSANDTGLDTQNNLDNIRVFAYRFARCIDGMQFGNEMFTGPGQYFFHAGDLPNHLSYEGSIRDIRDASTLDEAVNLVFAQIGGQGEAARIGSALAGRPLRIFSPAVAAAMTKPGYCGTVQTSGSFGPDDDYSATAINALVNYANDNRLILDQHTNYTSYEDFQETVDKITGAFSDSTCNLSSPWGSPDFVASLENGPMAQKTWWDSTGESGALDYYPPSICDQPSTGWVDYVNAWRDDLNFGFKGAFPLHDVFQKAKDSSFMYVCVNTLQQGVTLSGNLSRTEMGMLRATEVDPNCVDGQPAQFMPIATDYQNAASGFIILNFNPHPEPCDSTVACPN